MSLATNVNDLATRIATECKSIRTLLNGNAANNAALTTTEKSNVVLAINELVTRLNLITNSAPALLDTLAELAAALGNDENFATSVTTALAGKQALHANLTAFSGLTIAANKLPYGNGAGTLATTDFTSQARELLDDTSFANMRTTLDVYSKAEIGDPTTNFVTTFEAGLT